MYLVPGDRLLAGKGGSFVRLPEALPPLAGRAGATVRAAFLGLLALTALMLAAGSWMAGKDYFVTVPNNLEFGFVTGTGTFRFPDPDQVRIYTATSDAARRSGLRQDDIILSIDGRPVPALATELEIGDMMGEVTGPVATLVTRSSDGTVRTHRLPRQAGAWSVRVAETGLTGWQRSALLFGSDELRLLFLFAAALILYRRRPRDAVALIFASAFLLYCHRSMPGFWFWHSLGIEGVRPWLGIGVYLLLIAGLNAFPDGRFGSLWTRLTTFVALPAYFALTVAQAVALPFPPATGGYALLALLLLSAGGLIVRYRRLVPGPERQQIKWAVTGFAAFALLTAVAMVPGLLGWFTLSRLGPAGFIGAITLQTVSAMVLPLGLLVSLLRYRLYDADAAISRSAAYTVLTLLLLVGFAVAKKGLELFGERYFDGAAGALSGGVAAAAAALMITPIHKMVTEWMQQRFQKALIAMRTGLPELVGDLRETAGLRALAETAAERIGAGVRATRTALVIEGEVVAERGDAAAATALELPLTREDGSAFGAILLGPRPDGSLYGKAERQALDEVAGPVARAVRIVRKREAAAETQAAEMAELKARLAVLEERLGEVPLAAE
jgi:hypothetical protein